MFSFFRLYSNNTRRQTNPIQHDDIRTLHGRHGNVVKTKHDHLHVEGSFISRFQCSGNRIGIVLGFLPPCNERTKVESESLQIR